MDLDQLIRESVNDKGNKIQVKLPEFKEIWQKTMDYREPLKEKKIKKFLIGDWLQIAVVLLIITILPVAITSLRSSTQRRTIQIANEKSEAAQAEIQEAKKIANAFLTEYYTIEDYKKFTQEDEILYPNDPKTKQLKIYTTEKYYNNYLVPSTDHLILRRIAQRNQCNFQIDKIMLEKYSEDLKIKSIIFTSEVFIKCKFSDGTEKPASVRGQIIVQYDKDSWKIGYYTETSSQPQEIFKKL